MSGVGRKKHGASAQGASAGCSARPAAGRIDAGFRATWTYAILAGAEAAKGNDAEAKLALAEARRLNPKLTMKSFPVPRPPIIVDGLGKVGLPVE